MSNILSLFGFEEFGEKIKAAIITVVVLIAVVAIIIAIIKSPNARIFILTFLGLALVVSGIYCTVQLNIYYHSEGGIYGALTGLFKPNEVKVVNSLEYKIENIELTQKDDGNYSASITVNDVVSFDGSKNYGVFVNKAPCDYIEYSTVGDYLNAKYTYTFLDNDLREIKTDTLEFQFAFYTNSTYISIKTKGGADAVKYWNYYFNKNVFVITVEETNYKANTNIEYGSGDISGYCVATFDYGDKIVKQVYKKGSEIELPTVYKEHFEGWLVDNVFCRNTYLLEDDTTFKAFYSSIVVEFELGNDYKSAEFVSEDELLSIAIYYHGSLSFIREETDVLNVGATDELTLDIISQYGRTTSFECTTDGVLKKDQNHISWQNATYLKIKVFITNGFVNF